MNTLAKITCRTIGAAGMGMALIDSYKVAKKYTEIGGEHAQERYLEKAYYKTRTTDQVSYTASAIGEKSFALRTKNPLPALKGNIEGGFKGFTYALGNYLPAIAFSMLALVGKNWLAKLGALGVVGGITYRIIREGFGAGRQNPMN